MIDMSSKNVTCVICPVGCTITVNYEGDKVLEVVGNKCKRGLAYASAEVIAPQRVLTSSVFSADATHKIPVKSASPVPKSKLFEIMEEIKKTRAPEGVQMGDVIISNVAGTGVDIIATISE